MTAPVRFQARHRTAYDYADPVTLSHHIAHLTPRTLAHQKALSHRVVIEPRPDTFSERIDAFGNPLIQFSVETPHRLLVVESITDVEIAPRPVPEPAASPPWEAVRDLIRTGAPEAAALYDYCYPSDLVTAGETLAAYAAPDFAPGRPIAAALLAFTTRINREFAFDPEATTIATPVLQVLAQKAGVCQDFAHLMIGCLRSLGLPARYVSGYLRTRPPPGRPRLVGADASHAWVSAWAGDDWLELDPTNDCVPSLNHITLGYGRDYDDVSPLRGIILGGGPHRLDVGVDVMAFEEIDCEISGENGDAAC